MLEIASIKTRKNFKATTFACEHFRIITGISDGSVSVIANAIFLTLALFRSIVKKKMYRKFVDKGGKRIDFKN